MISAASVRYIFIFITLNYKTRFTSIFIENNSYIRSRVQIGIRTRVTRQKLLTS